ncbi:hypothetical protein [Cytobacillus purgationiresistens]|uniref:Uncharacterized protein n=1 Tax=Cytobacillus purgationiresistens TaxID=863449 RepID=A0ABU0ALH7_9BACI|nr:hypothetical protein [Cytobacillus purgationiresistens]MDQ0271248.1 hypothetical protein [Cytobacillus purgationiresistens]
MHSALLPNGKLVTANDYAYDIYGTRIFCMDQSCSVPVIFIPPSKEKSGYFKTSGKGLSVHNPDCGFFQTLSFQNTVAKVQEYQKAIQSSSSPNEITVRMNLNSLDPDYSPRVLEKEEKEHKKEETIKIKKDNNTPQSISSLKSIKKLFTSTEPDILASILVSIKGLKIPISELIRPCLDAHNALWSDSLNQSIPYFVHGKVEKVIRREKVWYINLSTEEDVYFSLVIFEPYFKYFDLKDSELLNKEILAYGLLKKNNYTKDRQSTEMIIKTQKYIEFL